MSIKTFFKHYFNQQQPKDYSSDIARVATSLQAEIQKSFDQVNNICQKKYLNHQKQFENHKKECDMKIVKLIKTLNDVTERLNKLEKSDLKL